MLKEKRVTKIKILKWNMMIVMVLYNIIQMYKCQFPKAQIMSLSSINNLI